MSKSNNYIYKIVSIGKEENPSDFFNWCIEHNLYKKSSANHFKSHLKVIYENEKERFGGCKAIVAFASNRPNNPIGICFLKNYLDDKNLNKSIFEMQEGMFGQDFKPIDSQDGLHFRNLGLLHLDNRPRKDEWQKKCDNFLINAGFLMLYVKKSHRGQGLASDMVEKMESFILNDLRNKSDLFGNTYGNENIEKSLLCFTAQELAYDIVVKSAGYALVTKFNVFDRAYRGFISHTTYKMEMEDDELLQKRQLKDAMVNSDLLSKVDEVENIKNGHVGFEKNLKTKSKLSVK